MGLFGAYQLSIMLMMTISYHFISLSIYKHDQSFHHTHKPMFFRAEAGALTPSPPLSRPPTTSSRSSSTSRPPGTRKTH